MKKITYEEAGESCTKDSYDYASGYNTAVELANKEIIMAIETLTADRDYWKGLVLDNPDQNHIYWASRHMILHEEMDEEIELLKDGKIMTHAKLDAIVQRIEKLEQKLIIDEQAQDTLYSDIRDLQRKIKKSKSNRWTQTVDNAIDEMMPALSETICELKLKVESLEKYILPITEVPTAVKVMMQHEERIGKLEQNAVMDGDLIEIIEGMDKTNGLITKIK